MQISVIYYVNCSKSNIKQWYIEMSANVLKNRKRYFISVIKYICISNFNFQIACFRFAFLKALDLGTLDIF